MDEMTALKQDPAFGSLAAIARVCGYTREGVRKWKRVPGEFCLRIEAATEGRWTRYRLRPDIYGTAPVSLDSAA